MSKADDTVLVLIDVQGRLAEVIHDRETVHTNLEKLVGCMRKLDVPVICTEQNPRRMGATIPRLAEHLDEAEPVISKMTFSCAGCPEFMDALQRHGRKRVVLCGIETHVCVYQTAVDLLEQGYYVEVAADAVSSRTSTNREVGLTRIQDAGGKLTSVEMLAFELMVTAQHPAFRKILTIIR